MGYIDVDFVLICFFFFSNLPFNTGFVFKRTLGFKLIVGVVPYWIGFHFFRLLPSFTIWKMGYIDVDFVLICFFFFQTYPLTRVLFLKGLWVSN